MSPGLLPLVLWAVPNDCFIDFLQVLPSFVEACTEQVLRLHDHFALLRLSTVIVCITAFTAAALLRQSHYRRQGERNLLPSALGYSSMVLLMLLLFPQNTELGFTVLAVIAFGDGAATLGGMLLRGRSLPWNPQKTWAGTLCFLACATPAATLFYWREADAQASFGVAVICGLSATLLGAVVETLPLRINDNIRVGLAAGVGVTAAHALLVGWA